jgi:hypothetical protein
LRLLDCLQVKGLTFELTGPTRLRRVPHRTAPWRKARPMEDLKFNIHAFTRPSTAAERSALLDEAVRMGEELEAMVDAMSAMLAGRRGPAWPGANPGADPPPPSA